MASSKSSKSSKTQKEQKSSASKGSSDEYKIDMDFDSASLEIGNTGITLSEDELTIGWGPLEFGSNLEGDIRGGLDLDSGFLEVGGGLTRDSDTGDLYIDFGADFLGLGFDFEGELSGCTNVVCFHGFGQEICAAGVNPRCEDEGDDQEDQHQPQDDDDYDESVRDIIDKFPPNCFIVGYWGWTFDEFGWDEESWQNRETNGRIEHYKATGINPAGGDLRDAFYNPEGRWTESAGVYYYDDGSPRRGRGYTFEITKEGVFERTFTGASKKVSAKVLSMPPDPLYAADSIWMGYAGAFVGIHSLCLPNGEEWEYKLPKKRKKDRHSDLKPRKRKMDNCCKTNAFMLRELYEVINPPEVKKNTSMAKELMYPGQPKGEERIKDYPGMWRALVMQNDLNRIAPFLVEIQDSNPAQQGDQKLKLKFNTPTAALQKILELLLDVEGDGDASNNILVRLAYEMAVLRQQVAITERTLQNIESFLGYEVEQARDTLPMMFDVTAGTRNKDKQKLEENTEEATERLMPELLKATQQPIKYTRYKGKKHLIKWFYEILNVLQASSKGRRL